MDYPRVLIDTSIVIEHLRKQDRQRSILYGIVGDYVLCTSTIIAATALTYGLPLLTQNMGHFGRIERLHLQSLP